MGTFIDITGQKFARLLVIRRVFTRPKYTMWECRCDCGSVTLVNGGNLKNGHTQSCGCLARERASVCASKRNLKHDMARSRIYGIWHAMKNRCYCTKHPHYASYGGRGIIVCDEWKNSFENFHSDMHESYLIHVERHGEDDTSLNRIDNDGIYSKDNCEWATRKIQQRNRKNSFIIEVGDQKGTPAEVGEMYGVSPNTIDGRYRRGWRGMDLVSKTRLPQIQDLAGDACDN